MKLNNFLEEIGDSMSLQKNILLVGLIVVSILSLRAYYTIAILPDLQYKEFKDRWQKNHDYLSRKEAAEGAAWQEDRPNRNFAVVRDVVVVFVVFVSLYFICKYKARKASLPPVSKPGHSGLFFQ